MRKIAGLAGRFLLLYALVVALWVTGLERRYDDYLAWVCGHLLSAFEEPRLTVDLHRRGDLLVVEHVPHFDYEAPQEIVTRRVHSNTALFVALTLTTPGVGWHARGLWLAGGAVLLSISHTAHILSYVHWYYALHNMGPYFSRLRLEESAQLGWRERWERPATWRRQVALAAADVFNIVAQRVVPIALWFPLFIGGWMRGARATRATAGAAERRRGYRWYVPLTAGVVLCTGTLALVSGRTRPEPPEEIEGLRLGLNAADAKPMLEMEGYTWVPAPEGALRGDGLVEEWVDAWRNPFHTKGLEARYNWIGLHLARPDGAALSMGCVTHIATLSSDERLENYLLETRDPGSVCGHRWGDAIP